MKDLKVLYRLSTYTFVIALIFLGGMYAGTKIISRLNDDELTELADDFESELGLVHEEYRKQTRLLERANQYLADSAVERKREAEHDRDRIIDLESTVERLQVATGESLNEIGNIGKTIQRIKESANGIGEDIRGLRIEVQKIQGSKRDSNWWVTIGEYDPEDRWRSLIDRYNCDYLNLNFQVKNHD